MNWILIPLALIILVAVIVYGVKHRQKMAEKKKEDRIIKEDTRKVNP